MKAKPDSNQEGIKASKEIIAEMVWREQIKACQESGGKEIKTGPEEVMVADFEANP
jgi:hypothetical protein